MFVAPGQIGCFVNHFKSPLCPHTAAQKVLFWTVTPSKKSVLKSSDSFCIMPLRSPGWGWCQQEGITTSGQCWRKLWPRMFVVCLSTNGFKRSGICFVVLLYFASNESGGLHSHPRCRFRDIKLVCTPIGDSTETTTVFPRRFPRPSSPCQNSGRTWHKQSCSEKTLWELCSSLYALQKASRCKALVFGHSTPPTKTSGWLFIKNSTKSMGEMYGRSMVSPFPAS